jgi:hypothetical protein
MLRVLDRKDNGEILRRCVGFVAGKDEIQFDDVNRLGYSFHDIEMTSKRLA